MEKIFSVSQQMVFHGGSCLIAEKEEEKKKEKRPF